MSKMTCEAKIQFRDPQTWSSDYRKQIADWMRKKAEELEAEDHNFAKGFTARFHPDY